MLAVGTVSPAAEPDPEPPEPPELPDPELPHAAVMSATPASASAAVSLREPRRARYVLMLMPLPLRGNSLMAPAESMPPDQVSRRSAHVVPGRHASGRGLGCSAG